MRHSLRIQTLPTLRRPSIGAKWEQPHLSKIRDSADHVGKVRRLGASVCRELWKNRRCSTPSRATRQLEGATAETLPTAIDYTQNTAGDIASDSEEGLAHVSGMEAKWRL